MYALLELNLAVAASRSSLAGALLRASTPADRHNLVDFLRGLSRDELECLAEFQGAMILESQFSGSLSPYRILNAFFDAGNSDRWNNGDDRAHKTFVVLSWIKHSAVGAAVHSAA